MVSRPLGRETCRRWSWRRSAMRAERAAIETRGWAWQWGMRTEGRPEASVPPLGRRQMAPERRRGLELP